MWRNSILILLVSICSGFIQLVSCTGKELSRIEGTWKGAIITHHIRGVEILQLMMDSTIIVTDSICYRVHSNKFEVAMSATIFNKGRWYLQNDSIVSSFDGALITLDTASFVLKKTDATVPPVSIADSVMRDEFIAAIDDELQEMYYGGIAYTVTLGKIIMSAPDSFSLINQESEMKYTRQ